jgi:hypothetical protein
MLAGCVVDTTRSEHAGELLPCDVKMETSATHTGAPKIVAGIEIKRIALGVLVGPPKILRSGLLGIAHRSIS